MADYITRALAAIGFAYVVLGVIGLFISDLSAGWSVTIAVASGMVFAFAPRDRKPAEPQIR